MLSSAKLRNDTTFLRIDAGRFWRDCPIPKRAVM